MSVGAASDEGFVTAPSHMANHVEQCAQKRGTEKGTNWGSGLKRRDPRLMWMLRFEGMQMKQANPRQGQRRRRRGRRRAFVCVLDVETKSHAVPSAEGGGVDGDDPSWQFNTWSTSTFQRGGGECQ